MGFVAESLRSDGMINLAAECRAVTEGHNCRLAPGGRSFLVVSDTRLAITYHLVAQAFCDKVLVRCDCPWGAHRPATPGIAQCKHASLVCRRLVREGLAVYDGEHWVLASRALDIVHPPCVECGARSVGTRDGDGAPQCQEHFDPFAAFDL